MGQSHIFDSESIASVNDIKSFANLKFTSDSRDNILSMQYNQDKLAKSRNLSFPTFDPFNFKEHIDGETEKLKRSSFQFDDVELIRGKYKVLNVLGKGQYGTVLRVQDLSEGKPMFYALKCFSLQGEGEETESFKTEIQILKLLNNENIVSYHDSFTLDYDPLTLSKDEKEGKKPPVAEKKKQTSFLCLVMEYVKGGSMDTLLEFSEKKKFHLPGDICIQWLLTMLDLLHHCHSRGICHRDLKPDNILVKYDSLVGGNIHEMRLILTDFGVGKAVKQEDDDDEEEEEEEMVELTDKNAGHLFYAPMEVLLEEGHDFRYDVYSLGVVFFQIYFAMSTRTYIKNILSLQTKLKVDPRYKEQYEEEVLDEDGDWDPCDYMVFLHEHDIYKPKFVDTFAKEDSAIAVLLGLMMTQKLKERATVKQLLEHSIVKTWRFIIEVRDKGKVDVEELPSYVDFHACVTFLKLITKDEDQITLFSCVLDVLALAVDRFMDEIMQFFLEEDGLDVLFSKFILLDGLCAIGVDDEIDGEVTISELEMGILGKVFKLLSSVLRKMSHGSSELVQKISVKLRKYCLVDIMSRYLICDVAVSKREDILSFVLDVLKVNKTICVHLRGYTFPLMQEYVKLYMAKEKGLATLLSIVSCLVPYASINNIDFIGFFQSLGKVEVNEGGKELAPKDAFVEMFRFLDWRKSKIVDSNTLSAILNYLLIPKIEQLIQDKKLELVEKFLQRFLAENLNKKVHHENHDTIWQNITLVTDKNTEENVLMYLNESEEDEENYCTFDSCSLNVVRTRRKFTKHNMIEAFVISHSPLCVFQNSSQRSQRNEVTLGYYEFAVNDGGDNDHFQFGVVLDYKTAYYVDPFERHLMKSDIDGFSELSITVDKTLVKNKRSGSRIWVKDVAELVKQMRENLDVEVMEYQNDEGDWVEISSIPKDLTHFKLRITETEIEENEIDEFAPINDIMCMSGDRVGCGVTDRANLFFTKNGNIVSSSQIPELQSVERKINVSAFLKFWENDRSEIEAVFGNRQGGFEFEFNNLQTERNPVNLTEKDRKKLEMKLEKWCKRSGRVLKGTSEKVKRAIKAKAKAGGKGKSPKKGKGN